MIVYNALVKQLDSQVERHMACQVLESGQPDCGGFLSPADGLAAPNGVGGPLRALVRAGDGVSGLSRLRWLMYSAIIA